MMRKNLVFTFLLILFLSGLLKGTAIGIDEPCEIMPGDPQVQRLEDTSKPHNALAAKLWWHPKKKMYIRQIVLYNDTPSTMITKEIYDYVMSLNPKRYRGEENFGYRSWPDTSEKFDFSKFK